MLEGGEAQQCGRCEDGFEEGSLSAALEVSCFLQQVEVPRWEQGWWWWMLLLLAPLW